MTGSDQISRRSSRLQNNFDLWDFLATRLEAKGCFILNPPNLRAFQMAAVGPSLEAIQELHFFQSQAAFALSFFFFPSSYVYQPFSYPYVSFFSDLFPT